MIGSLILCVILFSHTLLACQSDSDCLEGECCARNLIRSNSCKKVGVQPGDICGARQCPCSSGLECIAHGQSFWNKFKSSEGQCQFLKVAENDVGTDRFPFDQVGEDHREKFDDGPNNNNPLNQYEPMQQQNQDSQINFNGQQMNQDDLFDDLLQNQNQAQYPLQQNQQVPDDSQDFQNQPQSHQNQQVPDEYNLLNQQVPDDSQNFQNQRVPQEAIDQNQQVPDANDLQDQQTDFQQQNKLFPGAHNLLHTERPKNRQDFQFPQVDLQVNYGNKEYQDYLNRLNAMNQNRYGNGQEQQFDDSDEVSSEEDTQQQQQQQRFKYASYVKN